MLAWQVTAQSSHRVTTMNRSTPLSASATLASALQATASAHTTASDARAPGEAAAKKPRPFAKALDKANQPDPQNKPAAKARKPPPTAGESTAATAPDNESQSPQGADPNAQPGPAIGELLAHLRAISRQSSAAPAQTVPADDAGTSALESGSATDPKAASKARLWAELSAAGAKLAASRSHGASTAQPDFASALAATAPGSSAAAGAMTEVNPLTAVSAAPVDGPLGTLPLPTPLAAPTGSALSPPIASVQAEANLSAPPGSADFGVQLGAQLTTFVREGVEHARLHLHPAELGPVQVRIELDGTTARLHLSAEHADTRQALEQALPQLAGSLREAGLTLSGGGVFDQGRQAAQPEPDRAGREDSADSADSARAKSHEQRAESLDRLPAMPRRRGVVDLVA